VDGDDASSPGASKDAESGRGASTVGKDAAAEQEGTDITLEGVVQVGKGHPDRHIPPR
jgi:hypothetical protein